MVDRNEDENKSLFQWEAYNEFENSITSIPKPSKYINFFIYIYDVKDKNVYIKQAVIIDGKYHLDIVEHYPLQDFYSECRQHVAIFFKKYVAKKSLMTNESHKHFLITWGHAAGIGFFSTVIDNTDNEILSASLKKKLQKNRDRFNQYLLFLKKARFIKSHLSLTDEQIDLSTTIQNGDFFANSEDPFNGQEEAALEKYGIYSLKCMTAADLTFAIMEGFADDAGFLDAKRSNQKPKIDFLLCVACFTQMIETGDVLKDAVRVMIAPVTTISFYGYNYDKLFELISIEPNANEKKISDNLVNNYLSKYMKNEVYRCAGYEDIYTVEYRRLTSFNAVYLEQYSKIKIGIQKFVEFVLRNDNKIMLFNGSVVSTIDGIKFARRRCLETTYKSGVSGSTGIISFNNLMLRFFELYDKGGLASTTLATSCFFTVANTYSNPSGFSGNPFILAEYRPGFYDYSYELMEGGILSLCPGYFGFFLPLGELNDRQIVTGSILQAEKINTTFWDEIHWKELLKAINK